MRIPPPLCRLAAAIVLLAVSAPALPSGGDGFQVNRFASEYQVAPGVLNTFAAGNLGVVPGTYWRINLYLAYQAARGKPLNAQQMTALTLDRWHVGPQDDAGGNSQTKVADWSAQRAPYAALWKLPPELNLNAPGTANDYADYVNCHDDAFALAGATIKARAQLGAGGKPDAWHKAWLLGQDAVFSNCAEAPHEYGTPLPKRKALLPPALAPNAPDWLRYDHAYQTAAANFYSRNFDLAHKQFAAIGQDAKSPWHTLSAYLAARSLIRKALLDYPLQEKQGAAPERLASLQQAKKELEALAPGYAPAKAMLSLVEARINPAARIAALAQRLDKEAFGPDTPRLLSDYLVLIDSQPDLPLYQAKEPLSAWIGSMQGEVPADMYSDANSKEMQQKRKDAMQALRQGWLKQADPLWLAPLLTLARAQELSSAERKAAAAVPATHPLYQTIAYHLARLALLENHAEQADKDLERVMSTFGKSMSIATTNRFKALRMLSSVSLDDYLKAALRQPDPIENGAPIDAAASAPAPAAALEVDEDFTRNVFRFLPTNQLSVLLKHPALPASIKTRLQETLFTRALIFNDEAGALELLERIAETRATTRHLYKRYRDAKSGAERKLAAAIILVNTPELGPSVFDKRGIASEWGCRSGSMGDASGGTATAASPRFLSAQDKAAADKEQQILLKLPLRSEFMAPTLLEWARKKPNDEEAPKALHFLVASTRMECPYGQTKPEKEQPRARYSREAFDVLHKLYPNSSWTKQTKYFY
ncbi:MAG: hypothetical protein V4582_00170 [Pseudomonadota bacterium]